MSSCSSEDRKAPISISYPMVLLAFCLLSSLPLEVSLHAYPASLQSLDSIAKSPALVVGTIEDIVRGVPVPSSSNGRGGDLWRFFEARLLVHRVFLNNAGTLVSTPPQVGQRITMRYESYELPERGGWSGPMLPRFQEGMVALFAIGPAEDGSGIWTLTVKEGENVAMPALLNELEAVQVPATAQRFMLNELANTLENGSVSQQYKAARYAIHLSAVPVEMRGVLEETLGEDDDRWLQIAVALLGSQGIPRPTVSEFMQKSEANSLGGARGFDFTGWALRKGATREYPERLIELLVRNAGGDSWGSAMSLIEFKDSPILDRELTKVLRAESEGSLLIAYTLARNGQRKFLPDALTLAAKILERPSTAWNQYATFVITEFGDDLQYAEFLRTFQRFQRDDEQKFRAILASSLSLPDERRVLKIATVLIGDKRTFFKDMRYCDEAAYIAERFSKQKFGMKDGMSVAERDRVVSRVVEWLKTNNR